jgi:hypothetical protein
MKRITPAHAMLLALAALFVALGSGAYAVSKIGTKDIRDEAVTGKKLAKSAVKSNKTKDGGLKGKDLKDGTITSEKLAEGANALNVTTRSDAGSPLVGADQSIGDTASCDPGEVATGGGYFLTGDATHARVYNDTPRGTAEWAVSVYNDGDATAPVGVTARVKCAAP